MRYSTGRLLGYAALTFSLHLDVRAEGGVACKDLQGRSYESGFHYIPGPEPCTFCVCDNGNPKWCKAFICKFPEENCKSFRRGDTCCEFICLDDTLSSISNEKPDGSGGNMADGTANYDIGLRTVASFLTAVLSLSLLFFLITRLRRRKIRVCVAGRQSRQLAEDQRSLGNMGYLERGGLQHGVPMDDMPCGGGYPLWKPPESYFPRGEAPPPYEEAVAAARAEQALLSMSPHALSPLNFQTGYLSASVNHSASVAVVGGGNQQPGLSPSSPALSTNTATNSSPLASTGTGRPLTSPGGYANCHQTSQADSTGLSLRAGTSTTSFTIDTSANTYENLPTPGGRIMQELATPSRMQELPTPSRMQELPTPSRMQELAGHQYAASTVPANGEAPHPFGNILDASVYAGYKQHTTLPRQSGAFTISAGLPSSTVSTHRTIPRTLTARAGAKIKDNAVDRGHEFFPMSVGCSTTPDGAPRSAPPVVSGESRQSAKVEAFYKDAIVEAAAEKQPSAATVAAAVAVARNSCDAKDPKRPLNLAREVSTDGSFESVTCTCSMQALPTLHDDADDYRSECENCKSATGSRYYLDNEDELVTSPHETMTLHRRPEETTSSATPQYYRTSLTLPTSTRQRTRSTGVRENWFNTMPQSSTESSDEN